MGQKTHPHGFRLGVNRSWSSKWFEDKNYARWLHEDQKLRAGIKKKFAHAGIAAIDIEPDDFHGDWNYCIRSG